MDVGFATVWEAVADALPYSPAVSEPGRTLRYADFEARSARLAGALAGLGVGPGDRVACCLHNGVAYLETAFAAFKLGALPVDVDHRRTGLDLARHLGAARPSVLVFSADLAAAIRTAVPYLPPDLGAFVVVGTPEALPEGTLLRHEDLVQRGDPLPRTPRPGGDHLIVHTGGTTGWPRSVVWRQADLLRSIAVPAYGPLDRTLPETVVEAVQVAWDAQTRRLAPVTMPVVPMMNGIALGHIIGTLLVGGHVVFGPAPSRPEEVWRTVEDRRVRTIVVAGNPVCRPLVEELIRAESAGTPYHLPTLRTVLSSGTVLSDDVKRELHRRADLTILDELTATEGGPFAFATTRRASDLPSRFVPVPATTVFGTDDVEVPAGSGKVGLLSHCGPMPLGYHDDEEASAAVFRTIAGVRWSQPGDLVAVEGDGALRFLGRRAAVIDTGAESVYPVEVEEALLSHPAVRDAVVVGVPGPVWAERVAAVAAVGPGPGPDGGAGVSAGQLRDHVASLLGGSRVPEDVVLVAELPRSPSGKIELAWARQQVVGGGA